MRARLLKPGFFRDVKLLRLPVLTRLLFAGLWCLADSAGRLVDEPLQIKIDLLPADDGDVDAMLAELAGAGLIRRYEAAGRRYIQVVNFLRHQTISSREPASAIPAPCASDAGPVPVGDESYTGHVPVCDESWTGHGPVMDRSVTSHGPVCALTEAEAELTTPADAGVVAMAAPSPASAPVAKSAGPAPERPRRRDSPPRRAPSWIEQHPLFEPLVAIFGRPASTEWSAWGRHLSALAEKGATPEEIPRRAANYGRVMGVDAAGVPILLTLPALVKHWHQCGRSTPAVPGIREPPLPPPRRPTKAEGAEQRRKILAGEPL